MQKRNPVEDEYAHANLKLVLFSITLSQVPVIFLTIYCDLVLLLSFHYLREVTSFNQRMSRKTRFMFTGFQVYRFFRYLIRGLD